MFRMLGKRLCLVGTFVSDFHAPLRTKACVGKAPIVEFNNPS